MTVEFALEYIPGRMVELGYGDGEYTLRPRHYVLQAQETIEEEAFNQLFILVEEPEDVKVDSETGVFDISLENVNELKYEHQGQMKIINNADSVKHVRFIQVVFKKCK